MKCKKCGIPISKHNQYCHEGMCDDCFFKVYFPEGAQIIETDIEEIKKLCKIKEKENTKFKEFLKFGDFDQKRFDKVTKEIEEKIDCTKCGNCCKTLKIILNKEDIQKISKYLNLFEEKFIEKYILKNQENNFEFKQQPCIFLENNKCKIYEVRPKNCKTYPNLNKDITIRCNQFLNNAGICPIVFNVLENAKEEFLEDIFAFENPDI